jgi:hypothetical protein
MLDSDVEADPSLRKVRNNRLLPTQATASTLEGATNLAGCPRTRCRG